MINNCKYYGKQVSIGIIIPSHIWMSDENPHENATKTPLGVELPRVFRPHFPRFFLSDSNIVPEMINPVTRTPHLGHFLRHMGRDMDRILHGL